MLYEHWIFRIENFQINDIATEVNKLSNKAYIRNLYGLNNTDEQGPKPVVFFIA